MIRRCVRLLLLVLSVLLYQNSIAFAASKPVDVGNMANGVLVGQFKTNEKTSLANGRLFVYYGAMGQSSSDKLMRVPDQIINLDMNGRFSLELPAGSYYLSASKMPDVGSMGPPAEGELIYFKSNSKGEDEVYIVYTGRKTDAGVISSSAPFKRDLESYDKDHDKNVAIVEGIVTDADLTPVEGAVILAYLDPIQGKAFQVSKRTAKDGKFTLRLPNGGAYFLRVRSEYGGGTLKEGEFVNINDPKELTTVTLKNGEKLTGVAIRVKRLERGPLFKGNDVNPKDNN